MIYKSANLMDGDLRIICAGETTSDIKQVHLKPIIFANVKDLTGLLHSSAECFGVIAATSDVETTDGVWSATHE